LPKTIGKQEEGNFYLDEKSIVNLDQSNGDDDEEYSTEPRVLRNSSKPVEQKYKSLYAEGIRHQDSAIPTTSSGSKSKQFK
jgi:hypothetical protein